MLGSKILAVHRASCGADVFLPHRHLRWLRSWRTTRLSHEQNVLGSIALSLCGLCVCDWLHGVEIGCMHLNRICLCLSCMHRPERTARQRFDQFVVVYELCWRIAC